MLFQSPSHLIPVCEVVCLYLFTLACLDSHPGLPDGVISCIHVFLCQVAAIREGMSSIVPVPLLSLYTAKMLEQAVCGCEHVDLTVLKKVVRYSVT